LTGRAISIVRNFWLDEGHFPTLAQQLNEYHFSDIRQTPSVREIPVSTARGMRAEKYSRASLLERMELLKSLYKEAEGVELRQ